MSWPPKDEQRRINEKKRANRQGGTALQRMIGPRPGRYRAEPVDPSFRKYLD
ncbi:hypothetical protein [Corynebacterium sp. A21]|uniref:hypothetical protein n=1 Tax=Corynebacterium sp. A21 TaxID=3457318 RepID=UPI003FCFF5D0